MTQNLGAAQVADNQDQKEQTINDAVGRIDGAMTDVFAVVFDGGNAITVAALDFRKHMQFDCTSSGATGDCALTFASAVRRGLFVVTNGSGETVSVGVLGQVSPPTVADGDLAIFFCDGTTVHAFA